jgi:hypothetical protein
MVLKGHRRFLIRTPTQVLSAPLTGKVESKGRSIFEKYRKLNEEYDQNSRGYITWPPRTDGKEAPQCPMGW